MNIFDLLPKYAEKWQVKDVREFTEAEISTIEEAVVVASQYGNSCQFRHKMGGLTFIPMDVDATLGVGETVDLHKAKLTTLCKHGEKDIYRVTI